MTKTSTIKGTQKVAELLAKQICAMKKFDTAVIVGLSGELGSGKTVFAQGFAKALGVKEKVTSPTFVLLKRFKFQVSGFKNLIHIDAYRIQNTKEILDLGWHELVADKKNIILIEWVEKIKKILPPTYFLVSLGHINEKKRAIDIFVVK